MIILGIVTQIQSLAGIIRKINPIWADRCALSRRDTTQKRPITLPHSSFSLDVSCFACVCTCLSVLNPWGIHLHTLHLYYHWIIRRTLGLFSNKDFQIDRSVEHDGTILTPKCRLLISESTVLTTFPREHGSTFIGTEPINYSDGLECFGTFYRRGQHDANTGRHDEHIWANSVSEVQCKNHLCFYEKWFAS